MNTLDFNTPLSTLQTRLDSKEWLRNETIVRVEKAGEGNMNMVMKVDTDQRSFILKQSRPFVFKYPDIAAPEDRILVERKFYEVTSATDLGQKVPQVLHFDADEYLMMVEFIKNARDMVNLYETRQMNDQSFDELMEALNVLHSCSVDAYPTNLELRTLNHQHIFHLPFLDENGFSLDHIQPGLQVLSMPYKHDEVLRKKIQQLGQRYLSVGTTLLHGDYYPGSWMQAKDQVYLIDAEFSHLGFGEFDLGVMAGHLLLITSEASYVDKVLNGYAHPCDRGLVLQVAGTEIMRRLIGLAQLPLNRTLEEKEKLLTLAKDLILD